MKNGEAVGQFERECTRCGETRALDQFYRNKLGRHGRSSRCKPCGRVVAREHMAKLRREQPERDKAACARYYAKHKRRKLSANRKWDAANRERLRPIKARQQAGRRAADRNRDRSIARTWRQNNPDKQMAYREARRARKQGAPGVGITAQQWTEIREASLALCAYCNERKPLTMDHVDPLVRGGAHDPDNVVAACKRCNQSKGTKPLVVWLARRKAA